MSCSTCARIRRRIREEAAKLAAAIARRGSKTGGTAPARRAAGSAKASHSRTGLTRRKFIVDALATVAITTGLARSALELVHDKAPAWWVRSSDDVRIVRADNAELEQLWRQCMTGGGQPDLIVCSPEAFKSYREIVGP